MGRPAQHASDDTRSRLVAAARDVFLEGGVANFSLREVARRVGVSAAGVYRHFDGKDALVDAACAQGFAVFSSYLVRALGAGTPRERMLTSADQYLRFALENPRDYRFIFMSTAEDIHRSAPSLPARAGRKDLAAMAEDPTFRFLVDRVRECMAAGMLDEGLPEKIAVLIWSHLHGLISLRLSGHLGPVGDEASFAALYRESVERMLQSLGS